MSVFEDFEEPNMAIDAIIVRDKPIRKTTYDGAFVILGFSKCGQVSLQNYLQKRFPTKKCDRPELVWRRNGVKFYKENY